MRYFVSYARRDNGIERLREIRANLGNVGHVYVDDLECHGLEVDRVQVVVDALVGADVFVAVQSVHYLTTEWTRWEYGFALRGGMKVLALLSGGELVSRGDSRWPWQSGFPVTKESSF
ncbi:TIR domain-containing protein [Streptomyces sp. NPDC005438]|uniref:TIR domain-containing protein n=1 Tax=Streptomyces sp. NPDC005438 TaxID=3156880 RepID=UPI0033AF5992